jgi:cytochrome c553
MKAVISFNVTLAAILATVVLAAGRADDAAARTRRHPRVVEHVSSKFEYCTDCHGPSARGYRAYLTMPRLAGQQPEYLANQLRAFAERRRARNFVLDMGRVHGVGAETRAALARQFQDLEPGPAADGPHRLVETGRRIYQEGLPEANVPACAACHGPQAQGTGPIPRLAGQLYPYTVKTLTHWTGERSADGGDNSAVMAPIARNMSQSQISAVAAYLSYER